MEENHYGPHLTIDAKTKDQTRLDDLKTVYRVLDDLPGIIGMHKIMPPYVIQYYDCPKEDWGISGVVLIAESHISIHTYPEKNYLFLDIFSCKPFDQQKAVDYLVQAFQITEFTRNLVKRGTDFPK